VNTAAAAQLRHQLEPLVRRAGDHLLASFERMSVQDVQHKGDVDLVTRLDLESQAMLLAGLEAAFPGETIVAEEGAACAAAGGRIWYVDPLDGTTNFVHGQPAFAVAVGRVSEGDLDVAAIYAPYLREFFWGAAGCGAWLGSRRLHVSSRPLLDQALLATGFPYDIRVNPHNNLREWAHLAVRCRGLRRAGAAALDLAYVAAGRFDGFWEFRLQPWDLAGGALLVREAGGRVSTPEGGTDLFARGDIVATNGLLHEELRRELARAGA
jgi:myo-inositol-1(or 4)-monophosphatase